MAKPRRPLGALRQFRTALERYSGRRLIRQAIRPPVRITPSPAAVFRNLVQF